jgi:hypothetical protein
MHAFGLPLPLKPARTTPQVMHVKLCLWQNAACLHRSDGQVWVQTNIQSMLTVRPL